VLPKPLKEFVQQVLAERSREWKILQALHLGAAAVVADVDSGCRLLTAERSRHIAQNRALLVS
jgi:hypothetical protein